MLNKIKTLMGFASKSGNISSGQEQVVRAVRMGKAKLVIMALDVSNNSRKMLKDKCTYYGVDLIEIMEREEISKCIGKKNKTCVSINESGFAESIMKNYLLMQGNDMKAN